MNDRLITVEKLARFWNNIKANIGEVLGVSMKKGSHNTSIVAGDINSNKALSENSVAFGKNNIVGVKGYYFYEIDFDNNTIHLSPIQNGFVDSDAFEVGWVIGDVISIVNSTNYYNCSTITAINGCMITVDSLPFTSIEKKENPVHVDYAVFCTSKPEVGDIIFGDHAFVIGEDNAASFDNSFAVGYNNKSAGQFGFTQGLHNEAYYAAQALGRQNKAHGERSFAQGLACQALGNDSLASGRNCVADGRYSMARGYETRAEKEASNALGYKTKALGTHSMAWNESAKASGTNSTAFGINTEASASLGTAFGQDTKATGNRGTAMGYSTEASEENAVAMGHSTKAAGKHQLVTGKFNKIIGGNTTGFIVGGGSGESARKNAIEVDWNGTTRIAGDIYANYDGTNKKKLATEEYVDAAISSIDASGSAKEIVLVDVERIEGQDIEYFDNLTTSVLNGEIIPVVVLNDEWYVLNNIKPNENGFNWNFASFRPRHEGNCAVPTITVAKKEIDDGNFGLDISLNLYHLGTATQTFGNASVVTLINNNEYVAEEPINVLTVNYPDDKFISSLTFTLAEEGEITITLPSTSKYIGEVPTFANGETWELNIKNGVVVGGRVE